MEELQIDITRADTESCLVYAPLDKAWPALRSRGFHVISLLEATELMMRRDASVAATEDCHFVREGALSLPGASEASTRFVRRSPLLDAMAQAVACHETGNEYDPPDEHLDLALRDSIEIPSEGVEIPTSRFGSNAIAIWAFGEGDEERARAYGTYLARQGVEAVPIVGVSQSYQSQQRRPFARQLWIGGLTARSCLFPGRVADYDVPFRGIRPRKGHRN